MTEDEFADFLNKLIDLASDYGLVIGGHQQEEEQLQILMVKALERMGNNGRIDNGAGKGVAEGN